MTTDEALKGEIRHVCYEWLKAERQLNAFIEYIKKDKGLTDMDYTFFFPMFAEGEKDAAERWEKGENGTEELWRKYVKEDGQNAEE